jgi:flagella basal body P-ring formation protein FlgA
LAGQAAADVVVATRTIRAHSVLTAQDVRVVAGEYTDAFDRLEDVVGQEARVALFAGRPVLLSSIGPPALVERNQIVPLHFRRGGLVITTEGRAMERGGVGDRVRIMNLTSRATLFGFIMADGTIKVTH